jgi:hypothetical protein
VEVIHDNAFWRDLQQARHADLREKNGGGEYCIEKTAEGWSVSGAALSKTSHFPSEDRAMALARHLVGPKGGVITRVSNGKTTRQRIAPHLNYTPSGNKRDIELEEYQEYLDPFPLPVPDESAGQALAEWVRRRDQEVVKRATDALLKAGFHR